MAVRIEHSPGERYTSITVDGQEINRYVRSIDIALDADELPQATVRLLPASLCVELPDEAVRLVHDDEETDREPDARLHVLVTADTSQLEAELDRAGEKLRALDR